MHMTKKKKHDDDDNDDDDDDQARSKAMLETVFQSDAFERVPKRGPNPIYLIYLSIYPSIYLSI